ncbi:MAG: LacI family DNA-binding transcriptional regulator [Actinomycetota bacterium]
MTDKPRRPTMDDVAARAGVSRALVSLVVRGSPKVSEKRREAVLKAAKELGYRPNAAARSLAERRSNTVGVVINDLHNPFFADVMDGIHAEAEEADYRLLLNSARRSDDLEARAVESFMEYRVDAVILVGTRLESGALAEFAKQTPLVAVGAEPDGVDSVTNDDERGGELVAHHLIELGHTALAHIDGGTGAGSSRRRRGFVAACEEHGLAPVVVAGDHSEASGVRAVEELLQLQSLPSALFASNDVVAVAAIDRLEDAGLQVPDDISVVGYDNTTLAALKHIALTTVHQPRTEMGRTAMRCAMERIDGGRRAAVGHVLDPELIVRSTTAAATVDLHPVTSRTDRPTRSARKKKSP